VGIIARFASGLGGGFLIYRPCAISHSEYASTDPQIGDAHSIQRTYAGANADQNARQCGPVVSGRGVSFGMGRLHQRGLLQHACARFAAWLASGRAGILCLDGAEPAGPQPVVLGHERLPGGRLPIFVHLMTPKSRSFIAIDFYKLYAFAIITITDTKPANCYAALDGRQFVESPCTRFPNIRVARCI